MAFHFSANQFEKAYSAKRLNNWELPKWYPPRPRQIIRCAKIIANKDGHLLPCVKRDNNPWGNFRSTYMLPDRLTRRFGDEYNECLLKRYKWNSFPQNTSRRICADRNQSSCAAVPDCPTKCEAAQRLLSFTRDTNRLIDNCGPKSKNSEYIPGDFTSYQHQHPSRQLLLEQKYDRDHEIKPEYQLDKLYLGDHECKLEKSTNAGIKGPNPYATNTPVPLTRGLTPPVTPPPPLKQHRSIGMSSYNEFVPQRTITGKPNERCPSPIVPAYANFELARRMHNDNLDHQPLPDCVADMAYRKLQITGGNPGMALDLDPIATGVGVRTHNAGPTHCTKLKVYRPKTCGVVPKVYKDSDYRPFSSSLQTKKAGPMDLAICWDYKPLNPADEPQRAPHIDGSNDSAGPAVFTYVKTPRDDANPATGRSAGVFGNTLGEPSFFDKDIMRRKTDFTGRRIESDALDFDCGVDAYASDPPPRARSVSRHCSANGMPDKCSKRYQSSPNVMDEREYKAWRKKVLGSETGIATVGCKRSNPGFFRRTRSRLCQKVAPEPTSCCMRPEFETRMPCKAAFRAGVPKYNAMGDFVSSDSGCSIGSCHANRVVVVPRQRNPYMKKNYDIDTLVPPFRSLGGGAGQGGYPEHWRLSSVYQHAFKPIDQRRRPLLQTVYK